MQVDSDTPEQAKVRIVVEWYKKGYPAEYKAFVKQTRDAREAAFSKFGQMDGSEGRQLHDIPETMFQQLVTVLSPEEMVWFTSKPANHWFARTFPAFSLVREV